VDWTLLDVIFWPGGPRENLRTSQYARQQVVRARPARWLADALAQA
jgi:hypothetical protein